MSTTEPIPSGYASGDQYFATRYRQGERTVFSIDLSPAQITATIKRPDPTRPTRTNRAISSMHATDFARYLRTTPKRVIPPVLLRAPLGTLEFETKERIGETAFGILTIPRLAREDVEILDGQHRILGMHIEMESLSSEIREKRSERAQTHTHVDAGVRVARERALDADIANLEEKRRILGSECVTVQIIAIDDEDETRQMFADIATNAKGITQAVRSRFDQTRIPNRVMQRVIGSHPLLTDRVDGQKDRLVGDNPNLVSAQHVADAIRTILVGVGGRVSVRKEAELNEEEVAKDTEFFLDSLIRGFDDYASIVHGTIVPSDLRARSLLGSPVMFRVLAGVFHSVAMSKGPRPDTDQIDLVIRLFRDIQPWMQLPASWATGSPWKGSEALPEGARSAMSRTQSYKEMVRRILDWGKTQSILPRTQ